MSLFCGNHVLLCPLPHLPLHHSLSAPCVLCFNLLFFYFLFACSQTVSLQEPKFFCSPLYAQHLKFYLASWWWNFPKTLGSLSGHNLCPACFSQNTPSFPACRTASGMVSLSLEEAGHKQSQAAHVICLYRWTTTLLSPVSPTQVGWTVWKGTCFFCQKRKNQHLILQPSCSRLHGN
jgi:hypothetical protein